MIINLMHLLKYWNMVNISDKSFKTSKSSISVSLLKCSCIPLGLCPDGLSIDVAYSITLRIAISDTYVTYRSFNFLPSPSAIKCSYIFCVLSIFKFAC